MILHLTYIYNNAFYVKSKQQVKDNIGPLKGQNGEISSESKFIAEELNDFFASSFTRENTQKLDTFCLCLIH